MSKTFKKNFLNACIIIIIDPRVLSSRCVIYIVSYIRRVISSYHSRLLLLYMRFKSSNNNNVRVVFFSVLISGNGNRNISIERLPRNGRL